MSKLAAFRRGWVTLSQDFRVRGRPSGIFLISTKLDTFCYLRVQTDRATCSRFDTIPACDRRRDRQTDGIVVASTALAMRALRRAVKRRVQDRTGKSHKTVMFHLFGGKPLFKRFTSKIMW